MSNPAAERLEQGLRALTAFARPVDFDAARAVLSPGLMPLFERMRRSEQQHSLRVLRLLQAAGHTHSDLLVAALLHDCGKARVPLTLFGRTLAVFAWHFTPHLAERLSEGPLRGLRRPIAAARWHPAWSADDMAAAGASPLAVALARRHADPFEGGSAQSEEDRLLALLKWADDRE
jgi:hypothetical protein